MEIDPQVYAEVSPQLQAGERVLWCGRPDPDSLFVRSDLWMIPFSLMWGGFAIFWEMGVLTANTTSGEPRYDWFFILWGTPFVAAGLYMIFGRFIARRYLGQKTAYAITDRRALALRPLIRGGTTTSAIWLGSYPPVTMSANSSERGSITIGTVTTAMQSGYDGDPAFAFSGSRNSNAVTFWNIGHVNEVRRALDNAIAAMVRVA